MSNPNPDVEELNPTLPEPPKTADEARERIVDLFVANQSNLEGYYAYARQAAALAQEYHALRFKESFGSVMSEHTLITTCDSRESPKTLDRKMDELHQAGIKIRKIIFDRPKATYYLFT